jgi:hypothetical protein
MKSDLILPITVMLTALCGLDAAHAQTIGDSFQMAGWGWFIDPRCYQVTFVTGGGSNFCVPAGQNHYVWVKQGDWACMVNVDCPAARQPILIVRREGQP